jgi:hypothetical protein
MMCFHCWNENPGGFYACRAIPWNEYYLRLPPIYPSELLFDF